MTVTSILINHIFEFNADVKWRYSLIDYAEFSTIVKMAFWIVLYIWGATRLFCN